MKRAVIGLIVVAAIVIAVIAYRRSTRTEAAADHLILSGNVEAHESVVSFRTQGRIVELPIEEGQFVKQGDLLARLDDSDYRQQVRVDEAVLRTRNAELHLALAGSRSQDIRAAEQAVEDTNADLELKRADFARYQALYQKEAVSAQTRDAAETAFKRAQANYQRAQENLSEAREGSRKEQIAINRASLNAAAQNVQMSKVKLGFTVLPAPTTGVVLVRQAELGEVVAPGTPVVTIADLDHLWVRVYVSETDLGKVRLGQAAEVHTDTYPAKKYQGRISFISSEAEFTPKSVETHKERVALVYRMKIDVENPNHELKPGMPADVTIPLAK